MRRFKPLAVRFNALVLLLAASFPAFALADATPILGPINSDPLTQRGISPRILDVAIVPMSQGLGWKSKAVYRQTLPDGSSGTERFRVIFDPDTDYGRDLYIELESEPLRSARSYRRILEVTLGADQWLRTGDRLHDAASIKLVSSDNGQEIIEFRYATQSLPTSLKWLTKLAGRVYVLDGRLDRIELTASGEMQREGITHQDLTMKVYFGEVQSPGGHVISAIRETFRARLGRQWVDVDSWVRMLEYSGTDLGDIAWDTSNLPIPDKTEEGPLPAPDEAVAALNKDTMGSLPVIGDMLNDDVAAEDTIRLNLQRTLPIWADDVRKLGFELPKTYGLGLAGYYQRQDIDLQGFKVQGIDITNDLPLIDPFGSDVENEAVTGQLRADVWVLPFLNVSLLLGELETESDVTLRFTPGFRNLVGLGGGVELPEFYSFESNTSGSTVGLGLLTGFQYEQLVMSLGVNYVETTTNETNSDITSILWLGMVGYDFGAIGLQALAGVQYLDIEQTLEGSLPLEGGQALNFSLDLGIDETTFLVGFNKDIGSNWTLSAFLGANSTKSSLTGNFGYRW
ncbi:hypothetical protein EY643_11850 [Halioglobus maricola]|uniref:Uncharacterized protein n=1 Tax=Halioglobus maricola TaxID=2601894 RepID=A0A5P9NLC2_9GAMM|nr:hypothetical protein [Halioglobus maricola]QFU76296.1 hypothetical protein EY643_11850 [Halioglobus maricola]